MFDRKSFEGFGSRMENMLLSFPIYQLSQAKDPRFKGLNMVELGFSTMLFLLEMMLSSKKRATPDDVTLFLQRTVEEVYKISYSQEQATELRKYLLDTKLRNSGKKFRYPYTDYETGEQKELLIDLIEYDNYSIQMYKDEKVYLKLSNQGIELLFKTKEMYQEMQISITMLYFKQQLVKGAYSEALNSVNDLLLQIQQQINVFESKAAKLRSNVLSEFNYEKMKEELEKSRERTAEEKEQLIGLKLNVANAKENYQLQRLTKKEQERMNQIEEIERVLNQCTVNHAKLYVEKKKLLSTLKDSLELIIENMFSKTFHFEKEVIDKWYENQMNQEKLSAILVPMMPMRKTKMYNPLEAFSPQKTRKLKEVEAETIEEIDSETIRMDYEEEEKMRKEKEKLNLQLMKVIFKPLLTYEDYNLSDALNLLQENDMHLYSQIQNEYLDEFLMLCIKLHRSDNRAFSRVSLNELFDASEVVRLLVKTTHSLVELEDIDSFSMVETCKKIEFPSGDQITDFKIIRKVSEADAV